MELERSIKGSVLSSKNNDRIQLIACEIQQDRITYWAGIYTEWWVNARIN